MRFSKGDLVRTRNGIGEILHVNESLRFPYLVKIFGRQSSIKIENCKELVISPANEGRWYSEGSLELIEKRNGLTNEERRVEIVKKIMEVYDIEMNKKFNMLIGRNFQSFYINENYRLIGEDGEEWQRLTAFLYNPERIRKIPTRMTLGDIEGKLGYKVDIVDS